VTLFEDLGETAEILASNVLKNVDAFRRHGSDSVLERGSHASIKFPRNNLNPDHSSSAADAVD